MYFRLEDERYELNNYILNFIENSHFNTYLFILQIVSCKILSQHKAHMAYPIQYRYMINSNKIIMSNHSNCLHKTV